MPERRAEIVDEPQRFAGVKAAIDDAIARGSKDKALDPALLDRKFKRQNLTTHSAVLRELGRVYKAMRVGDIGTERGKAMVGTLKIIADQIDRKRIEDAGITPLPGSSAVSLPEFDELLARATGRRTEGPRAWPSQAGPVLPPALPPGEEGRGAPVDPGADSGGPTEP